MSGSQEKAKRGRREWEWAPERQTEEKRKREKRDGGWGRYSIQIFPLIHSGKNMRMGE